MKALLSIFHRRYRPHIDSIKFYFFLLRKRKSPIVGLIVIFLLVIMGIFAPILAPYEADEYTD